MSLWGRIAGALPLLSVVLISCKDELSILGFKDSQSRFKVVYKELALPSAVMYTDSLATHNGSTATTADRILVGRYVDDEFGTVAATGYLKYRPLTSDTLPADALPVSAELYLTPDYYYYGGSATGSVTINVHLVTDPSFDRNITSSQGYYSNTLIDYDPVAIGSRSIVVEKVTYDAYAKENQEYLVSKDTAKRHSEPIQIILDDSIAQALVSVGIVGGPNFTDFEEFKEDFRGFALVPDPTSDFVIGFNPNLDNALGSSKLLLKYTTVDSTGNRVQKELSFGFLPDLQASFSYIDADRQNTPILSTLGKFRYKPVETPNGLCYVQAGDPVVTKVDFSEFFNFTDTAEALAFNMAEMIISGVEPSDFPLPSTLTLGLLDYENEFLTFSDSISVEYLTSIRVDAGALIPTGEREPFKMTLTEVNGKYEYKGLITDWLQLLFQLKGTEVKRFGDYAIIPTEPDFQKSVNRLIFHKDSIKLRLYYTVPLSQQ